MYIDILLPTKMSDKLYSEDNELYSFAFNEGIPRDLVLKSTDDNGITTYANIAKLPERKSSLSEYMIAATKDQEYNAMFIWIGDHQADEDILDQMKKALLEIRAMKIKKFKEREDIMYEYKAWREVIQKKLLEDQETWSRIKSYTDQLLELPPLKVTNEKIIHRRVIFPFTFPDYDPMIIINEALASLEVPMIVYHKVDEYDLKNIKQIIVHRPFIDRYIVDSNQENTDTTIYKVYTDNKNLKLLPSLNIESHNFDLKNGLYLQVYKGDDTSDINPDKDYSLIKLDMKERTMRVDISTGEEKKILNRIKAALPKMLILNGEFEVKIKASFEIRDTKDIKFYPDIFAHIMLREPMFRYYIYLDETRNPIAISNNFIVKYGKELSSTIKTIYDPVNKITNLIVTVSNAPTRKYIDSFKEVLSHLIRFYIDNYEDFYKVYAPFKNALDNTYNDADLEEKVVSGRMNARNQEAPDIFSDGYDRSCQGRHKVSLIKQGEITTKIAEGYEVMPFPKNNPKVYCICEDPEFKYPGVKVNTKGDNREQYPYIPCCYKTSQMDPKDNSNYNEYIYGQKTDKSISGKADYIYKKLDILKPYKVGQITVDLNEFLNGLYPNNPAGMTFYRMGIIKSPSSLIHCVLESIGDPSYINLDFERRELYVRNIRHGLAGMNLEVLRQQFPTMSIENIRNMILDPEIFLDPLEFLRLIELRFGMIMYTLKLKKGARDVFKIAQSKHQNFSVSPFSPGKPTMVIIRNNNGVDMPQCELIIDFDKGANGAYKLFGDTMNIGFYKAGLQTNTTLTWTPIREQRTRLEGYVNIYSQANWSEILKGVIFTGMHLDTHGKMRGLNFQVQSKDVTVFFLPTQPENVPVTSNIYYSDSADIVKYFNLPSSVSTGRGLWYTMSGRKESIYFPVKDTSIESLKGLPVSDAYYIESLIKNQEVSIHALRKQANYIVQILRWLYDVHRQKYRGTRTSGIQILSEFLSLFSLLEGQKYNFNKINQYLPTVNGLEQALTYITSLNTGLVQANRIIVYNQKFYGRLMVYMKIYQHDTDGLYPEPAHSLSVFADEGDFNKQPNNRVFLTENRYGIWLKSEYRDSKDNDVVDVLTFDLARKKDPFVYRTDQGNYFLIQNIDGHLLEALHVSLMWSQNRINIGNGKTIPIHVTNTLPYAVLSISRAGELTLIKDETGGQANFLWILTYSPGNEMGIYAAMLPLN